MKRILIHLLGFKLDAKQYNYGTNKELGMW